MGSASAIKSISMGIGKTKLLPETSSKDAEPSGVWLHQDVDSQQQGVQSCLRFNDSVEGVVPRKKSIRGARY